MRSARCTGMTLVGIVTLTLGQLLPSAAAAQSAGAPPPGYPQQQSYPAPQAYPPPQGYPPAQGYPPPQYFPPPGHQGTVYQRPSRRPKGLLIAGPIVLGASYGFTALVGLQIMSTNTNSDGAYCTNCDTVGPRLLIPILGPWLALPAADGDDGKVLSAMLGIAQATGLLLTIVGISRYRASAPDQTAAARGGWRFALVPSKGGGLGVLGGSF